MRRQAAASPSNNDIPLSNVSMLRQQVPTHNFGGVYGNGPAWAMGNPATSSPYPSMASGMYGGGDNSSSGLQEKTTPPSPRVTPPSYRNRTISEGPYGLLQQADPQQQLSFVADGQQSILVPPQASPVAADMYAYGDVGGGGINKRAIPHVYHDYSHVPAQSELIRKKAGGVTIPFPEILYGMLENPNVDPNIVSWLPHGRAFLVKQPKRFTSEIMPKYVRLACGVLQLMWMPCETEADSILISFVTFPDTFDRPSSHHSKGNSISMATAALRAAQMVRSIDAYSLMQSSKVKNN